MPEIRNSTELNKAFQSVFQNVIETVSENTLKLLQDYIDEDTYQGMENEFYERTYQFRDVAWVRSSKGGITKYVSNVAYNGMLMEAPDSSNPYKHGYLNQGIDNREVLADLLNIDGVVPNSIGNKIRKPFWNDFINEAVKKVPEWLYDEFLKEGLEVPGLKGFSFDTKL